MLLLRSLFLFQLVCIFSSAILAGDLFLFTKWNFFFRPGCFPVPFMLLHLSYFFLLFIVTYLVTRVTFNFLKSLAISPNSEFKIILSIAISSVIECALYGFVSSLALPCHIASIYVIYSLFIFDRLFIDVSHSSSKYHDNIRHYLPTIIHLPFCVNFSILYISSYFLFYLKIK